MIGIPGLAQMTEAIGTAFKGTWAQMTEIFLVEHDEDGKHTDITAHSITTTPNTPAGATGNVAIGGDLSVDGLVGPLDFGTASTAVVLDGTVIGPETIFDYSAFPSFGATADTTTGVLRSVRALTPATDGSADLGYEGDTLRRWRNGLFKNLVETKYLHATTALYERSRSTAVGEWKPVTYSSSHYTSDAGVWSVSSGQVEAFSYMLIGKTMFVNLGLVGTSPFGAGAELRVAIPGGFVAALKTTTTMRAVDNAAEGRGLMVVATGGTFISCYNSTITAWTNAFNLTTIQGTFAFEVQ